MTENRAAIEEERSKNMHFQNLVLKRIEQVKQKPMVIKWGEASVN